MSPKRQSIYTFVLIAVALVLIWPDGVELMMLSQGMPINQPSAFPFAVPQSMPSLNPMQSGFRPGYPGTSAWGQSPQYGSSKPQIQSSILPKPQKKASVQLPPGSNTPLGSITPEDILKKAAPVIVKKYIPKRLHPPSPPNTNPSAQDFSKMMDRLDKRNENTEALLESVAPSPSPCSDPSKIFSSLSAIGQQIGNAEKAVQFDRILELFKGKFPFTDIVRNGMILSYYIKILSDFIAASLSNIRHDDLKRLVDVFQSSTETPPVGNEGAGSKRPKDILRNYVSDSVVSDFAISISNMLGKVGSKFSPLMYKISTIIDSVTNEPTSQSFLSIAEGQISRLLSIHLRTFSNLGASAPLKRLSEFVQSISGIDGKGGAMFTQKSLGILLEKTLKKILDNIQIVQKEDGLPDLRSLLSVLGPVGAFCIQLASETVIRVLLPFAKNLIKSFGSLLNMQIPIPYLTEAIIIKAGVTFAAVPDGTIFIPTSTSLRDWLGIISACVLYIIAFEFEKSGERFQGIKNFEYKMYISSKYASRRKVMSDLAKSAARLPELIHSSVKGKKPLKSIYEGLSLPTSHRISYLIGALYCTCSLGEGLMGKSRKGCISGLLRLPFSFLKLLLRYPMAASPLLASPNDLPERELLLQKLTQEKKQIYEMQQGAWLFGLAGIFIPLLNLINPSEQLPLGIVIGFMMGSLPETILNIWSVIKSVLVLMQEAMMTAAKNANIYQALFVDNFDSAVTSIPERIKTPYGTLLAKDLQIVLNTLKNITVTDTRQRYINSVIKEFSSGTNYIPTESGRQLIAFLASLCKLEHHLPITFVDFSKQRLLSAVTTLVSDFGMDVSACRATLASQEWALLINSILLKQPYSTNQPMLINGRGATSGLMSKLALDQNGGESDYSGYKKRDGGLFSFGSDDQTCPIPSSALPIYGSLPLEDKTITGLLPVCLEQGA